MMLVLSSICSIYGINVSFSDITSLTNGQTVEIPITVSDLTGSGVISYYADVSFSEAVLNCTGVIKTGTLSSGWGAPTVNTSIDGRVTIAAYGTQPLTGQGTLLKVVFTVVGTTGLGSPLNFDVFQFNEGTPVAVTQNGYASVGVPTLPAIPSLNLPANGAINLPVQTTLSWNPATNARFYQLQVATSNTFASGLAVDQSTISSNSYSVSNLQRGTTYYWRVKSIGVSGNSNWSQVRSFTTILNHLPVSTLPQTITSIEDQTYSQNIQTMFTDSDSDPITVTVNSSAHITASITQWVLQLVPSPNWSGTEGIRFSIFDGYDTVLDTIFVTLTPINDSPVMNLPTSMTFAEDGSLSVNMANYATDVDNVTIFITAQNSTNVFVSITDMNATLTATTNWSGTEIVHFTVSDGVLSATGQTNVIVTPVNDAPVINLPASFTFAEDGNLVVNMTPYVSDIDNTTLTLTAQNSAHVSAAINGLNVTLTATANWSGTESVGFTVSDGTLTATGQTSVIVTQVNDAPVINLPVSFTFAEDGNLVVNMATYISDVDNTNLTITAQNSAHITVVMNGLSATLTSSVNWNGTESVSFTVSDGTLNTTGQSNVVVTSVNDAPTINLPASFTLTEDGTLNIYMGTYVNDVDTVTLTVTAQNSTHIFASFTGLSATLTATANWSGTEIISFTVSDGLLTATGQTSVIVTPVNDAPVLALPASFTFVEDSNLVVNMASYVSDVDNTTLTVTAQNTAHITVVMNGLSATLTATANWNGTEVVNFTVSDGTLNATSQTNITVSPVNDAPVINLPDSFTFAEDGSLLINMALYISDVDNANLILTASGNNNVTVAINGLNVTLGALLNWSGTEQVNFTVNDNMGRAIASDITGIIVTTLNDAPVINLPASISFAEDGDYVVDVAAYISDVDNTTLTVTAQNSSHITVVMNGLSATLTSSANWNGTEAVSFTVSDGLLNTTDQVNVIVTPVNDSPVIDLPASFTFAEDGTLPINMTLYASDIDNANLTLSASGNTNVTVTITGMNISLGTLPNWSGTEQVTFTINDNMGRAIASDIADVIVTPVNDPPTIESYTPIQTTISVALNETLSFIVTASDVDSPINYSWFVNDVNQNNPSNALTYQFTQYTTYEVRAVVSDNVSTVEQIWTVAVPVANDDEYVTPTATGLQSNYPNPFKTETTISYRITYSGAVNVSVFNLKGQMIKVLKNENQKTGAYNLKWNGLDDHGKQMPSGVYFIKLISKDRIDIVKCLLII